MVLICGKNPLHLSLLERVDHHQVDGYDDEQIAWYDERDAKALLLVREEYRAQNQQRQPDECRKKRIRTNFTSTASGILTRRCHYFPVTMNTEAIN